jgi:hypothetical protein
MRRLILITLLCLICSAARAEMTAGQLKDQCAIGLKRNGRRWRVLTTLLGCSIRFGP